MRNKSFEINIPQPCHEKWDSMTATEKGNFCLSCQKIVIDFTQKTDSEINQFLQKPSGRVCGRFRKEQLNRPIVAPRTSFYPYKRTASFLFSSLLFAATANAQQLPNNYVEQAVVEINNSPKIGKIVSHIASENRTITGVVRDDSGEVLIGANVVFYYQETLINGVSADIDGLFSVDIPQEYADKTLEVVVSYVGYEDIRLEVAPTETNVEVILPYYEMIMGMMIIAPQEETVYQKSKQFWNRIKYDNPIGNWLDKRSDKRQARQATKLQRQEKRQEETATNKSKAPKVIVQSTENSAFVIHSVSPNPFQFNVSLDIEGRTQGEITISLFSETGEQLYVDTLVLEKGQQTIPFDFQDLRLPSASYILNIFHENGFQKSEVLVFQNN